MSPESTLGVAGWNSLLSETNTRTSDLVAKLEDELRTLESLPLDQRLGQVENHPILERCKTVLREQTFSLKRYGLYDSLLRRYTAIKLGMHLDDLDDQDDFVHFARKNYLHRYLLHYGHIIKRDPTNGEILLLHKGSYEPWGHLKAIINLDSSGVLQGAYGQHGLQDEDGYSWSKLHPYKWEDPTRWNKQYLFEHCLWTHDKIPFQLTDNHSWIRLRTPEGAVYSVGEWPEDKGTIGSWWRFPLRVKKGKLMSPDVSEFWRGNHIRTFSIAITEQQFLAMKAQIEADKRVPDRAYHLLHSNCTSYASKIAEIANAGHSASIPITDILIPTHVRSLARRVTHYVPPPIRRVGHRTGTVALNLFANLLGYYTLGEPHSEKAFTRLTLPPFHTLFTVPRIDHPHPTLHRVALKVEAWRQEQTEELALNLSKIEHDLQSTSSETSKHRDLQQQQQELRKRIAAIPWSLPENFHELCSQANGTAPS